jgi:hypothetical protein
VIRPIAPLWRAAALCWWKRALQELSHRDPHHPDLPGIVLRVRDLEREEADSNHPYDWIEAYRRYAVAVGLAVAFAFVLAVSAGYVIGKA